MLYNPVMWRGGDILGRRANTCVVIVIVVPTILVGEISGTLVLMRLRLRIVSLATKRTAAFRSYIVIALQSLVNIARRELVEFFVGAKDDDSDIDRTQY